MQTQETNGGKLVSYEFDSWSEFLTHVETAEKHPIGYGSTLDSHDVKPVGDPFNGCTTWQAAMHLARTGWAEGESRLRKAFDANIDDVLTQVHKRDYYYAVEGEDIDVSAYAQGRPEAWITSDESRETKHITLRLNCAVSSRVEHDVIFARGAAIAILAEALSYAGHQVRVQVSCGLGDSGKSEAGVRMLLTVKEYDQPLDMHRLAFTCANPDMLRRLVFALCEASPEQPRQILGGCYGYPCAAFEKDADVYVGHARYSEGPGVWANAEETKSWVLEQLKKQGVQLEGGE